MLRVWIVLFTVTLVLPGRADEPAFPDVMLTTQNGAAVRFYSDLIQDNVIAINHVKLVEHIVIAQIAT